MLNSLKRIHKDEEGLETLQVVAILAVAAIILAVLKIFWNKIEEFFTTQTEQTDQGWNGQQ